MVGPATKPPHPWGFQVPLSRVLALALCIAASVRAQDLDLVLYAGDPAKRSMFQQIEDPEERSAFQELKAETDPAAKRALAEEFLKRYPQSWLLSFAHSMAAMSAIALDDLRGGLEHGRASLRLLPENGTLLVALANVQVHAGLLDEAARSAADALEYLPRFRRPSHYSAKQWARIARELEASAHFVQGRVSATRGLRATGSARLAGLAAARESLRHSLRLNAADGIALYLLGIVEQELGNDQAAQSAFAEAARVPGPVRSRALEALQAAHQASGRAGVQPFGDFHAAVPPLRLQPPQPPQNPAQTLGLYAGSESCAECHQEIFTAWSRTGMARMFRNYAFENVIGDFEGQNEFTAAQSGALSRMFIEDGRHYFELPAGEGRQRYRVDYTIGSKWQQAYATRLPNGRIHVLPVQYNLLHRRWVNFWEILDDGPSERSVLQNFHRLQTSTSYQLHCAPCHTSQVQAEGTLLAPERINFRETGINCEMCHGPSRAHVDAVREGRAEPSSPATPPLRFGDLDHRAYVDVCAQCHMQSGIIQPGPRGEINYSGKQAAFLNRLEQRPYEEFSRNAFYKDGRFRETTFIVEAFLRSECYRQGQAHCGHCHDPHPADASENPTSLKFREDPDRMCLQCHAAYAADPPAHTRHAADSEASRCTACHMPKIMNSMMFQAGTHRIDDIPDAAMTARFGQDESPNACLQCHADESQPWLARSLADW